MTLTTPIKRPESLSEIAEAHIRNSIVRGVFKLGESLPEAKLSAEMGISKTPVREALAALKLQGLVQFFPQRGAFVFTLTKEDVLQLCHYRMILEGAAIDAAMKESPTALISKLDDLLLQMSQAHENSAFDLYLELDAAFHEAFFEFGANAYLKEGYQKVSDIVRTMLTHLSKQPERTSKSFQEHDDILTLLREGKLQPAKDVLNTQITRGIRSYSDFVHTEGRDL